MLEIQLTRSLLNNTATALVVVLTLGALNSCKSPSDDNALVREAVTPDESKRDILSATCGWRLAVGEGDRWDLVDRDQRAVLEDVTALIAVDGSSLLVSCQGVYGRPGIWIQDAARCRMIQLIGPSNFSEAYPDGEDYFRLESAQMLSGRVRLRYWRLPSSEPDAGGETRDRSSLIDTVIVVKSRAKTGSE